MMRKTILVILCLCYCGTNPAGGTQWIPKCCPRNGYEIVTHLTRDRATSSFLECIPMGNSSFLDLNLVYGIQTNDSDVPSRIPVCPANAKPRLYELNELTVVTLPIGASCVDLVNGTYQVVMCTEDLSHSPSVEIYALRKCCPVNFVYDLEYRTCVELQNQFEDVAVGPFWANESMDVQLIKSLLNKFQPSKNDIGEPLFHLGTPQCGSDEALISHYLKSSEFYLRHNRIIPTSSTNTLLESFGSHPRDAFCIDSVAPTETIHPPPRTSSDVTNITWVVRVCRQKDVCDSIPCVRKCCNYNEKLVKRDNATVCDPHPYELNVTFHDLQGQHFPEDPQAVTNTDYGILFKQSCPRYILDSLMPADLHYLNDKNGYLHLYNAEPVSHTDYCMDYVQMGENVLQRTFVCFHDDPKPGFFVYAVGLCISCVFLVATLIVYACLPKQVAGGLYLSKFQLLNLHGKTLVSHVCSLLVAYAGLAYIQFGFVEQPRFCHAVALFTYGAFLAAFSWLNVMCFDIWWTFGSVRQSRGMRKTRDTKRFVGYSVYAWGISLSMTTFIHLVDHYKLLDEEYRPNMGLRSCWFSSDNGMAHRVFFLLPMGIIISMNGIFFVLTAVHCNRVKSEIHRMQANDDTKDSHKKRFFADKARLCMNVKLFSVMGISWVLELITSLYKEPVVLFYFTDFCNVLQGVFVFLIFVFKRNVLIAIKKRLGMATRATRGVTTMGVTNTTGNTTTSVLMGSQNQVCVDPYKYKMTKSGTQSTIVSGIHRQI